MFPHALSVVKKLVEAKKNWLIVGKGPNYDKELVETWLEKNENSGLISVNDSLRLTPKVPFDLVVSNDFHAIEKVSDSKNFDWFCTPACISSGVEPQHRYFPILNRRMKILFDFHVEGRAALFDVKTDYIHHNFPLLFSSASSVESAVQLLAHNGIRKINFTGIYGGIDYHKDFGYRENRGDIGATFLHLRNLKHLFKIDYVGLRDDPFQGFSWKDGEEFGG